MISLLSFKRSYFFTCKNTLHVFLLAFVLFFSVDLFSTTYYNQSAVPQTLGNWNTLPGGGGASPANFTTAGDIFIIDNEALLLTGAWVLGANVHLQIDATGSLDLNNRSITVGGTTTIAGAMTDGNNAGTNTFTGLVTVTGSMSLANNSACNFGGGIINNGGTVSFTGTKTIDFNTNSQDLDGTALISFGTGISITVTGITVSNKNDVSIDMLRTGAGTLTLNATAGWIQTTGSRLNYYGSTIVAAGGAVLDFDTNSNIVDYASGSAQTILLETYYSLYVSGAATKTLGGAVSCRNLNISTVNCILASDVFQITGNAAGTMTMAASTTLTLGNIGSATDILFPTNFVVGNITLNSASTVTYQSSAAQTVSNVPIYGNLTLATSGTKTLTGGTATLTVAGNLAMNGTADFDLSTTITTANITGTTVVAGTLTFNGTTTKTVNITGNLSGAGTINMSGGSLLHILNLAGTTNTLTTLTTAAVASTVNYNGTTQTVFGSPNYRNLTISNSGTKTMTMAVGAAVNNDLLVNTGTELNVAGAFTFAVSGNSTIAGTLGPTATTTIINLQTVDLSGGQLGDGVTGTINIAGALTMPTGTGTFDRSTINVNSTTTIAATRTLTFNVNANTGVKTFVGLITLSAGTSTFNSSLVTTAGNLVLRGGVNNAGTFTTDDIYFTTSNQNLSGAGTYSFGGPALISGAITVTNQCSNVAGITFTSTLNGTVAGSTWEQDNGSSVYFTNATAPFATAGTLDAYTLAETNTVYYNGVSNAVCGTAGTEYYHLTMNGSGTATLAQLGNINVHGDFSVINGLSFAISGAFTFDVNGASTIAGILYPSATTTIIDLQSVDLSLGQLGNGTTGTINLTTLAIPTGNGNLNRSNITVSGITTVATGRTLSLTSATGLKRFDGQVSIVGTGIFDASTVASSSASLEFRAGINNANTFTAGGANFSTSNQALQGAGTYSFSAAVIITGAITLTNQCSNAAGIVLTSTIDGTVAGSTWKNDPNTKLYYGPASNVQPMNTGVLDVSANGNLVSYNRNNNQNVKIPLTSYYHLTLENAGTKTITLTANLNVVGDYNQTLGVNVNVGGAFILDVDGNSSVAGVLAPTTTTTTIDMQALNLSNGTLGNGITATFIINGNLTLPTANAIINRSAVTVSGTTTIPTTRSLTLNNNNGAKIFVGALDIQGTGQFISTTVTTTVNCEFRGGIDNDGTFSAGGATFSTGNQSLTGTGTYTFANNVNISTAISVTNSCTNVSGVSITGALDGAFAGSIWEQDNGSVLTLISATRPFTTAGVLDAYTLAETNTVYYDGVNNNIFRGNAYYNLYLNGTGTAALSTTLTSVYGTLTIETADLNNSVGILQMETGSTIVRYNTQFITNAPTFAGTVNVIYRGGSMTTGPEMPVATAVLSDLTINVSGGTVTLGAAVTCNGICTFTDGNISLATFNFTLAAAGTFAGVFDNGHMIECNSTGKLIKKATSNAQFVMTYPIGTGTYYTPAVITAFVGTFAGGGTDQITFLPVTGTHPLRVAPTPYNGLEKYWTVTTTGISAVACDIRFYYVDPAEITGTEASYVARCIYGGAFNTVTGGAVNTGLNYFSATGATITDLNGDWIAIDAVPVVPRSWYSYQSGDWADPLNWTLTVGLFDNPSLLVPGQSSASDDITIQNSHTVFSLVSRVVSGGTVIEPTGILDMQNTTANNLGALSGSGKLRLNTFTLPTATYTTFVATGGGTIEYYDVTGSISTGQLTYCNLLFTNSTGAGVVYTLDNPANPTTYTINGTLTTSRTGAGTVTVTLGNVVANAINLNVTGSITNGAGCTMNCSTFDAIHSITCGASIINNGTFDMANNAAFSTATTGAAHIIFTGTANNVFTCNGTTEVYSLHVNKGTDQTWELALTAPTGTFAFTTNGAAGHDGIGVSNGTLILGTGVTLSRIRGSNNNFNVSYATNNNGCLKIDGATVTSNYTCNLYGKFWMKSGTCTFGNNGINMQNNSEFYMEGGTLTVERIINGGAGNTVATFTMTGGTLNVDNTPTFTGQNDLARFSLPSASVTFIMSGGTINIKNPINDTRISNAGFALSSSLGNYNITGGTWNFYIPALSTGVDHFDICSTVPFYDLNIYSQGVGTCKARLNGIGGDAITSAQPLVVLHDFTIGSGADAPVFDANGYDVTVGGNFTVNNGGSYLPNGNTTTFNGPQAYGRTNQIFTINTAIARATNLVVNNTGGSVTMAGGATINCLKGLTLTSGIFADGGQTIDVSGDVSNSSSHSGAGQIRVQRGVRSTSGVPASTYTMPSIQLTGQGAGTAINATITIKDGVVTNLTYVSGGAGYTSGTNVYALTIAGGNGAGFTGGVETVGGNVTSVWVMNGGSGYGPTASEVGGAIYQAVVTGTVNNVSAATGTLTSVNVLATGEGYASDPTINVFANGATGATSCIGETDTPPNIGGSGSGTFTNFSLNNDVTGGGAVFTANQTVNGNLRLLSGILNIGSYSLTLAGATNIYSDAGLGTTFSSTKMIKTNGLASAGGIVKTYSSTSFTFPLGTATIYTPGTIALSGAPTAYGSITMKPVASEHPLVSASGQSLTYYWNVASSGFTLGAATVTQTYTYDQSDVMDNGLTVLESAYVPGKFDLPSVAWIPNPDNTKVDDAVNNTITFDGALYNTAIDGDYTAGDQVTTPLSDPFAVVLTYYSRNGSTFDWNDGTAWSVDNVLKHTGAAAALVPTSNSIVRIGDGVTYFHTVTVDANTQASGALLIANGSTLDIGTTTGHNFGTYATPAAPATGNGKIRISSADATADFPAGDFNVFIGNTGGELEYYTTGAQDFAIPAVSDAPTSIALINYYDLTLTPATGRYIQMPDVTMTIYDDLTVQGVTTGMARLNTASAKSLTITDDLLINSGNLQFRNGFAQAITIGDDITVATGAIVDIQNAGALVNTMSITGTLTVNGTGIFDMQSASDCALTFTGNANESITGTGGTIDLYTLTLNKGTSQTPVLNIDFVGTFTVPAATNYEWLTLTNGTFRWNKAATLNISSNTTVPTNFSIPATTCLSLGTTGTGMNVTYYNFNADIILTGKLEVLGGTLNVGDVAFGRHNDIEIDQTGTPTIDVQNAGILFVNGQIRRATTSASGALVYSQSGTSQVNIRGVNSSTSRGRLEICNTGSSFNMSGTSILEIRRGNGIDGTFGDLYIAPTAASAVASGTLIRFVTNNIGVNYTFGVNTNITLANLTIDGTDANDLAQVNLLVNPLTLTGNLIINDAFSAFNASGIAVNIQGNLTNSNTAATVGTAVGGYRPGSSTQVTTFNSTTASQTITGVGANITNFGELVINNTFGTVTFAANTATTVNGLLTVSTALAVGNNIISVLGNNTVNAAITGTGKVYLVGTAAQTITGTGSYTNIDLNNSSGNDVVLLSNMTINGVLTLSQDQFFIDDYLLTFGASAGAVVGANTTRFIKTNGAITDLGIRKMYGNGVGTSITFAFELGVGANYRPASYTGSATTASAYLNLKQINVAHPNTQDVGSTELLTYWNVDESGMSAISVTHNYTYVNADVQGVEASYVTGRYDVTIPDWSPINGGEAGTSVTTGTNLLAWTAKTYLDGDYTAGYTAEFTALKTFYSRNATLGGNWTDVNAWSTDAVLQHAGAPAATSPNGGPVIIASGHTITMDAHSRTAASISLLGTAILDCGTYQGHVVSGSITGTGTLKVTANGGGNLNYPTATYTTFVSAAGGTMHWIGSVACTLPIAFTQYNNVIIDGTATKTIPNTDLTVLNDLTISNAVGNVLSNTTNNRNITIGGDWTNDRLAASFLPGTGTVTFNGTGAQTIGGTATAQTFYNLTVNKTVATTLSQTGSTTTLTCNDYTNTQGDFDASGFTTALNINATVGSADVILTSGTFTAPPATISVTGNWTNNGGTFTSGTSTVSFTGTGAQAINGTAASQTFNNITIAKTAGTTLSKGGSTTTLTCNDLTQTTGNFDASGFTTALNINTSASGSDVILTAGTFSAPLNTFVTGNWTKGAAATFTPGLGTVNITGTGAQALGGTAASETFYNLTVNKAVATTLTQSLATVSVTNRLTMTEGIFNTGTNTLSGAANIVATGGDLQIGEIYSVAPGLPRLSGVAYNITGGTITFNGAGNQLVKGLNTSGTIQYNNIILSGSGTKTLNASSTVFGDWTNNGVTVDPGTTVVTFTGTGAQAINGTAVTQTFYDIVVNKTAGQTLTVGGSTTSMTTNDYTNTQGNFNASALTTALNINATLGSADVTLTAGTFTAPAIMNVTGNWTNNGGTFTQGVGIVNFTGNAGQTIGGTAVSQTFYDIVVNKSVGTTLSKGGITTALTCNDLTQTQGNFNASGFTTAFNINATNDADVVLTTGTFTSAPVMNITGDWTNNGAIFAYGTGTVSFNGTLAQTIGGTTATDFYSLTLNNLFATLPQIVLNNSMTVANTLTMTSGVVDLSGNVLTLGQPGVASTLSRSASSVTNWVYKGTFRRYWLNATAITSSSGNNYGLFPTGWDAVSSYCPLEINTTVSPVTGGLFTANFNAVAGTTDLSPVYNDGGTNIERLHNSTFTTSISGVVGGTYNISATMTNLSPGNLGDIRLASFTGVTTATAYGTHAAATGTAINPTANRVGITTLTDFNNGFNIASTNKGPTSLPIELLSFDAKENDKSVDITWSTASEINNDYFTVEKSIDGVTFEFVANVKSKAIDGNSTSLLNYSIADSDPYLGVSYYRLKQIDLDGQYSYSNAVAVEFNNKTNDFFNIYPNPNNGLSVTFAIDAERGKEILIELFDVAGKKTFSEKVITNSVGKNVHTVDFTQRLTPGVYLISVSSQQSIYKKHLIVK